MKTIAKEKEVDSSPSHPHLRYRRRIVYLLAFYLPVLIFPWVLTCIIMYRPLSHPSYIDQQGGITTRDVEAMKGVAIFVNALDKISSTLAVPVVSALLSQAAVVYVDNRRVGHGRWLNVRQLFALADRGWSDLPILFAALGDDTISSGFLWMGAGLVCIAAIQPALQPILISDENIVIVARDSDFSHPHVFAIPGTIELGTDPEPGLLARVPRDVVLQQTQARIIEVKSDDVQQYLWHDTNYSRGGAIYDIEIEYKWKGTIGWYYPDHLNISDSRVPPFVGLGDNFFVSSILRGTSTGALRYHAIRQQSLSNCEVVPREEFPSNCPGANPFVAEYHRGGVYFRVCVGGNQDQTLWNLTRNSQLVSEHVWMDAVLENSSSATDNAFVNDGVPPSNFTIHCTVNSTRGFFELNNLHNDNSFSRLLYQWPSPAEMSSFNDDLTNQLCCRGCEPVKPKESAEEVTVNINWTTTLVNSNMDPTIDHPVPGPLMAAAMTLFGNHSFFDTARTAPDDPTGIISDTVCNGLMIPFSRYSNNISLAKIGSHLCTQQAMAATDQNSRLHVLVWNFISLFADINIAIQLLEVTMYFANEAHLTLAAGAAGKIVNAYERHDDAFLMLAVCFGEQGSQIGRTIYSSPGTTIIKPRQSPAGVIIVSILITAQIVGLLILAHYICSSPTWTQTLDAYALARIGALLAPQMKAEDIDGLREHPRPEDVQKALVGMSGVFGIVSHGFETGNDAESHILLTESAATVHADVSSTEGTTTVRRRMTG